MKDEIKRAPFTDDEVRILKLWQENDYLHPYTCCGETMEPTHNGLKCHVCEKLQDWVQDYSLLETAARYTPMITFGRDGDE